MIRVYQRLTRGTQSVNLLNRAHVSLENSLTPLKAHRLIRELLATDSPELARNRVWAREFGAWMARSGKPAPEPFVRHCVRQYVAHYTGPAPEGRQAKTLVICVTGALQRMMVSLAMFLQCLDAAEVDVVVLRYPRGKGFRNGVPGLGVDFEAMLQRLPALVDASSYGRVVAVGTSGGAAPALMLALANGFDRGLAVGIGSPHDERWAAAVPGGLGGMLKRCLVRAGDSRTRLMLMHGADDSDDADAVAEWKKLLPNAMAFPVASKTRKVGHVALHALLESGRLPWALRSLLIEYLGHPRTGGAADASQPAPRPG